MINFLWFDLGYTLVYLQREQAYVKALADFGVKKSYADVEKAFHFTDKLFMREYPGIFGSPRETYMPWYLGRLNYFLGVRADIFPLYSRWMEYREKQQRQWHAFDFCVETLGMLKAGGYRLGIISNWDSTARAVIEENGLTDFFDTIVISSEVGVEKPDPRIFIEAFRLSGSEASEGLYVGDNYYDDAVGSRRAGMDFRIINRFGRFGVEEIEDCEIIPDIRGVLAAAGEPG